MDVIYGLLPGMLLIGALGVGVFIWSVRSGQYDDLEGDANRILFDDESEQVVEENNGKNIEK
jgi:cbb3-type cytochrome oxidase maturation protein